MNIPLARPDITEKEIEAVVQVLKTPHLSLGPKLPEFEGKLAQYAGVRHAIAVNSGTSALHLIIRSMGIDEGDEVITTAFSFISSANCILFERAKPVFVDIDSNTLSVDPELIEAAITPRTKAILAVDVFGHPAEWDRLKEIADKHGLRLIEDSAEALGAEYNSRKSKVQSSKFKVQSPESQLRSPQSRVGSQEPKVQSSEFKVQSPESQIQSPQSRVGSHEPKALNQSGQTEGEWKKAGSFGDAAVFAFYPNKQITTGEGGMVLTDDEKVAELCRSLRNQGRGEGSAWLQHERLGYNYRLSDINCALGIAQLERIEEILANRDRVARVYNEYLAPLEEKGFLRIPYVSPNVRMSWFVYVIRLADRYTREGRDCVLQGLRSRGIGCSDYFQPIHLQPFYRELGHRLGDLPITEHVAERTVALPFHNRLSEEQVEIVIRALKDILKT